MLLVEDEAVDVMTMRRAIDRRDLPASVLVAGSAEDAMERLGLAGEGASDRIEGVDLVVADLKLPRLSGLELLERLRASERHAITPCIVLSTSGQESEAARAYALGAAGYFVKPLAFDEYANLVESIVTFYARAMPIPFMSRAGA